MRTTWLWLVVLLHWSCGQCDGASFGRPEGVRQPLKDASAPGGDTTTKRGAGGVPDPIHAAANCASLRDSAHECCVMYLSNAALMFKHIDDPWFLHKHALGAQRERWAALGCTRYAAVLMAARESEDSTVQRPAGRQRRADTEVASALTARGAGGDGRLFIGVLSPAVGAKAQRDRNLYRDRCVPHYSAFEAPYKFFVALPDTNPLPKKHWQGMLASDADAKAGTSLMQEAADFGDIEVLSFAETYANLPLKTLGIMKFAAEHGYSYMMKIDVEYCVHVPAVLAAIREHERLHPGTELYLGDKAWHGTEYDSMKQKDGVRVPFGRGLTWGLSLGLAQLIAQADWIHSVLYLSYGSSSEDVDLARWVLYAVETHGVAVERLYHENAFFRTIAVDMDPKFARCLGMYKANPSAKIGKTWGSMTKDDQATWHQLQCDHLAEHLDDRRDVFLAQRNMQTCSARVQLVSPSRHRPQSPPAERGPSPTTPTLSAAARTTAMLALMLTATTRNLGHACVATDSRPQRLPCAQRCSQYRPGDHCLLGWECDSGRRRHSVAQPVPLPHCKAPHAVARLQQSARCLRHTVGVAHV